MQNPLPGSILLRDGKVGKERKKQAIYYFA